MLSIEGIASSEQCASAAPPVHAPFSLLAFRDYAHYFATPSVAEKPPLSTAYSPEGIKTEKDQGQGRVRIVAISTR